MSSDPQPQPPQLAGQFFLPGIDPDPEGLDYSGAGLQPASRVGKYTAARFFSEHPQQAQKVCALLGRGVGQLTVAELVGVSVHTVRAVLEYLPEDVAMEKQRHVRRLKSARGLALDAILCDLEDPDRLAKIPTRDKAIILGILGDQLKGGGPANVTVHLHAPDHRDLDAYLSKLQPADVGGLESSGMGVPSQIAGGKTGWAAAIEDAEEVDPASPGAGLEEVAE
jgi:hypothetical protein